MATLDKVSLNIAVVLGTTWMPVHQVLRLGRGAVIELDKRVGEPVDIFVNDRLVARGEMQLGEDGRLAVSMTELASVGSA